MKKLLFAIIFLFAVLVQAQNISVLVEAENFDRKGGWVVDQQFIPSMGSPYLLAHGMGTPVKNASTTIKYPESGRYYFWIRTKDWIPERPETPGTFQIIFNGKVYPKIFGTNKDWQWVQGGSVSVDNSKELKVELQDLTGFEGRCDAIYFSKDKNDIPPKELEEMSTWRKEKLDIPPPKNAGEFDLVVVGGGLAGCGTAVAAARQGLKVALINDRPVLGGNASQEIRVHTLGLEYYTINQELSTDYYPNGDERAIPTNYRIEDVVRNEKNISVFINTRAFTVNKDKDKIVSVDCFHIETHSEKRFEAPLFVDATGDGWIGYWAGCEIRIGAESRNEFKESLAPGRDVRHGQKDGGMTLGNTVLWNSENVGNPSTFPEVPWATDVARDYIAEGAEWFWEYGHLKNTIYDAEHIRDHLFRAIYGTWYNIKQDTQNANLKLKWVAYIAGKRESRRIMGDYIFKESDVIEPPGFEDGFVKGVHGIDRHYPRGGKYSFLADYVYTKVAPYEIPYRSLYSKDIDNLFMVGRCFSSTHIGMAAGRVQNTTTQMGIVVGYAAAIAIENNCNPRDVYKYHLPIMRERLEKIKSGAEIPDRYK